jgi:DNA-binding NtrC family response regulator/ligand-binding sensor domain-containing protein
MGEPQLRHTLARLTFWVPPAQLAEFEAVYETRIAPILSKHGLVESAERGRPTAEGMFSRLFAVANPAAIAAKREALGKDPQWQELGESLAAGQRWQEIGERLSRDFAEGEYLTGHLDLYSTPAGPGKQVTAGPGTQRVVGRGRGHWRTFDATDGLPGGIIRAILQDPEGTLWIGTFGGGLSRYDGQQFRRFGAKDGLPSPLVQSVALAHDGSLWIGTYGNGIYHYEGQRFRNLTTADGLVSDHVLRVLQDREGCLWVGTVRGLGRWDGSGFSSFTTQDGLPADGVHAIFQDRAGCLWVGTGDVPGGGKGGVCRYDGCRFTPFTAEGGLAAGNGVWSIYQDREGILWFGTAGGVSRYDGKELKTFTTEDGLGSNEVWVILQDREGMLWFGTKYGGVSCFDGQDFTTFTTEDGLGYDCVETISQDREGALWFGTWNGLSRYEPHTFTTFTAQDGLPDSQVLSICQDRAGALWFGTAKGGLCQYDGHTFTTYSMEDGLPDNRVSLLFQDPEGILWFSSATQLHGKGVCRYDGHSFTTYTTEYGLAHDRVLSIFQDREGARWFGGAAGGGASRYDGQVFAAFTVADGLACSEWLSGIAQDQEGALWFSTVGGGVSRYDGQQFRTFTTQDGLVSDRVFSMIQDQEGVLWFGTMGEGLSRYDGQQFRTFTAQDGLADTTVLSVFQDRQGRIWTGTFGGVSCYDGQVFQTLTTRDGLADNGVFAVFQDQEGSLWFGTTKGVTRYRPAQPSAPAAYIDAVVAERRYEGVPEVEIPDSVKVTAFAYHALSLKTRPEAMVYRYRLAGYDVKWANTPRQRVEFEDLPVGEYVFQVQAVDRDLNYSDPAEVRLKVVPDPRDQRIACLEQENRSLRQAVGTQVQFKGIIGRSRAMEAVYQLLGKVVDSNATVLLTGETGTGKEVLARCIHQEGPRQRRPLVAINCGALAEQLLESELFGHRKGSFTGAVSDRPGLFEAADGGTLFRDEIGETTAALQVRLLRAIQEGEIRRVGEERIRRVDVRVIAATHRDLHQDAAEGRFREDLYYRLSVFPIHLPPLRERREDIPELALHFLAHQRQRDGKSPEGFTARAMDALCAYDWPGNIRELQNEVERAALLGAGETRIDGTHLSEKLLTALPPGPRSGKLKDVLALVERDLILQALQRHQSNRTHAAADLGMSRWGMVQKIKEYGIEA